MATTLDNERLVRFEEIFKAPTIEAMLALSPGDFELFVQYVFECAGYGVVYVGNVPYPEGPGVDLDLVNSAEGSRVLARVEVRRYTPPNSISLHQVAAFIGLTQLRSDTPGYMVTTSDFTPPGYVAAKETNGRVRLINGEHLLRFITYVGGSRLTGPNAPRSQNAARIAPTFILEADSVKRQPLERSKVLAVANNKGGVAKTTTVANLGLALADQCEKRVLLVDMDGQASLSRLLPPPGPRPPTPPPPDTAFLSDFILHRQRLPQLVRPTRFERLWLIPAHADLLMLDKGGGAHPTDELGFVRSMHDGALVAPDGLPFDWIILDTPPAQSFYTRAAMAASHYVLLPAHADALAVLGANRALDTAQTMRALMGDGTEVLGGLITRWRRSAEANKAISDLTDALYASGSRLLTPYIPDDTRIEKAHLKTVGGWLTDVFHITAQAGPAATAYTKIAKEVLCHVHSS